MMQMRTHTCGELRLANAGQRVKIVGWMENVRVVGQNFAFVVLRDFYGTTQVVVENQEMMDIINGLNKESTISVEGTVRERASKNPKQATGDVEVVPEKIEVLGRCRYNSLPFEINRSREADETQRLKYRYLDLRNPAVKSNIILRCQVVSALRAAMTQHGFLEITTPILTASSPEGARDYLVPARKHPGKFYALPQAPQQFKQLLMTSGFDRYFQIAPCFRDEDARADRSPGEFYQLDMEMAFASQDDVFAVLEDVLPPIFAKYGKYDRASSAPFMRIPYTEAMEKYKIQPSMVVTIIVVLVLMAGSFFLYRGRHKQRWLPRLAGSAATAAALCLLVFGVYLQPAVTQVLGITPDAWMQDRYYRYYGVITGFMTNLTNLEISKPEEYSQEAVDALLDNADESQKFATSPLYSTSYSAVTPKDEQVKQPTIIYVMDESYWDVSELEQYGITFDTDVSKNLHALQQTSAYGRAYSPSFGGGTCDVEFEALTGYSVSFLPSGSKPYQQHVTKPMFAMPNYLKLKGYQTAAVHCFWAKYWSRDKAYPNLGFDDFISLEDMHGVTKVRKHYWTSGLVTDDSMADQIIQQYESMKSSSDKPIFLHAVTMQNHTNYNKDNYPDDERVKVLSHPAGLKPSTVGALEDFATGIRDADAMMGKLTEYFSQVDEPVILVFWGDHYNPIDSNYDVYTTTGYASDSSADPRLHQTTLLMWSNYSQQQVDLGTIAAYDISPVMMDIYGLEEPLYFQFLNRQLRVASRTNTRGTTMNLDGTTTQEPTEFQQRWSAEHWLLQYDLMFGRGYALQRMGLAGLSGVDTGK